MSRAAPPAVAASRASLDDLVSTASIIVCSGPGGVGKTTTAAALAIAAAERGRRAVVVTIDPARRLADALGLRGGLTNAPTRVELPPRARARRSSGELWAMMLDTRATFDAVVRRYAADERQAEGILANRFYENIAGALSGTQEYMAAEKLYELHADERFDLVVVDTPPTRNALDFLDAPGRLTRFLDHKLYRALMLPTRLGLKVVNVAAQAMLKTIAKVVGGEVIADVMAFFAAFDGMEAGFRRRAIAVTALLRDPGTHYVVITSPRREAVAEARYFAARLHDHHASISAVVVNRVHPRFDPRSAAELTAQAGRARAAGAPDAAAWENLAELTRVAEGEAAAVQPLAADAAGAPIATVPLFVDDVHDLDGLTRIARHLFA